jgi:hypothetical protein
MIKSINLKEDNCFITVESNRRDKTIVWFVDDLFDIRRKLATYKDGKWSFSSLDRMDELIKICKQTPKIKRAIIHSNLSVVNDEELPAYVSWNCFKRRLRTKVQRMWVRIKLIFTT